MVKTQINLIDMLENIKESLYRELWKCNTLGLVVEYKEIADDEVANKLLERFEWLIVRNRFVEARRLVEQEIDNANGVTVEKCKRFKVNKGYCRVCTNYNCSNNENKENLI